MKKLLFLCAICCAVLGNAQAQKFDFGIKGGVSTGDISADGSTIKFKSFADSLSLRVSEASLGVHFGVFARMTIGKFFIQPEILFNSASTKYAINKFKINTLDSIRSETYRDIDIPVMLGFKFSALRLSAGPVGHYHIGKASELLDIAGYEQKFSNFTFGYQLGLGFDLGALTFDLRYENNFADYGSDRLSFAGKDYKLGKTPARTIASLGYKF